MTRKKRIWIEVDSIPKNIEHSDKLIIHPHKFIKEDRLIEILAKKRRGAWKVKLNRSMMKKNMAS